MGLLNARTVEGFVTSCLAKKFDQGVSTPDCHREWWELATSNSKLVAIAAPRG